MKKSVSILMILLLLATSEAAVAGGRHGHYPHRGYHHHHNDDAWIALGIGLLTSVVFLSALSASAPVPEPQPPAYVSNPVWVNAWALNIRSGPGLNHSVIGLVRQGAPLQVIDSSTGWFYVRTPSGTQGWVMAVYTRESPGPNG